MLNAGGQVSITFATRQSHNKQTATILLAQLALQREAVILFGAIEKTCIYIAMPKFIHRCSLITLAFQIFL